MAVRLIGTRGRQLVLLLVCAVVGIGGVLMGARAVAHTDAARARLAFRLSSAEVASSLKTVIRREEDLPVSASVFLAEHPGGSPMAFERWVKAVRAFARYPELQALGLVALVPAAKLPALEANLIAHPAGTPYSAPGAPAIPDAEIFPPGKRPFYCVAVAGWARDKSAYLPAGVDYCALAGGLMASRDSGQTSYAPLTATHGTLLGIETPVYRGAVTPATVAARRRAFLGWFGELVLPSVVIGTALEKHPGMALTLSYDHGGYRASFHGGRRPRHFQTTTLDLYNGWLVRVYGPNASAGVLASSNSAVMLLGGSLLVMLVLTLTFVLSTGRARALALVDEKTRELSYQARHDSLTGLANRALVLERASHMLSRVQRDPDLRAGALFIDVDRFKEVNDVHGHAVGDELLKAVAQRIDGLMRAHDTVGRLGGDEFVVLAEPDGGEAALVSIASRIIDALVVPFQLKGGVTLMVTASVGIAVGRYRNPEALLRDADRALYEAKARGKNRHAVFSQDSAPLPVSR